MLATPSRTSTSGGHDREQPDLRLGRARSDRRTPSPASRASGRARRSASRPRATSPSTPTKKSGVARMPATASGALGAVRRRRGSHHIRPASMTRARNSRVRCSRGAVKISAGGPSSRITPAVEEADLVGDLARERHLVRRDDHRHPGLRQLADEVQDLCDELRVERARDLVEQHQLRLHRQSAHDRDALLLAAREPVGELVRLVEQADPTEQLARLRLRLVLREALRSCAARA